MRPLSTRTFKLDASYKDIIANVNTHKDLKAMKQTVIEEGVVFFIYRGGEDHAIVMMHNNTFSMHVCPCPGIKRLESNPDLIYAMCYGISSSTHA